jgi:oligogalacturonide lyase
MLIDVLRLNIMKSFFFFNFLILITVLSCTSGKHDINIGKSYIPEVKEISDRKTGAPIKQLTNYKGHSHHFYFTNPGWFSNESKLLFSSDRDNRTNLFSVDLNDYSIQQLTDLKPVPLPREVEFFRSCRNPVKEQAFFWHDRELKAIDLVTNEIKTIYELDEGWNISMSNCSADGKYVYFGTWEDLSHLFEVDLLRGYVGFDETWEAKPHSKIIKVATDGSHNEVVFEEKYWIGHVNTSPSRSDLLTFCHEGPWEKVDNRIWCLNVETKEVWKIRPRTHPGERVGHEYWYADGETIGFHGSRADGSAFLGHVRYDNTQLVERDFSKHTGHIHSNDENLIVGDGGGVIKLWKWNGSTYEGPRVLTEHKSSMQTQHSHPHPRFNKNGTQVLYTSDISGYCNVYLVDIPPFNSLPLVE